MRWPQYVMLVLATLAGIGAIATLRLAMTHHRPTHRVAVGKNLWVTRLEGSVRAPPFTLTDQRGKTISLDQLRGKVVVLEFFDPKCTDICPIVAREFILANQELGKAASAVVYLAVNVNAAHRSVADVRAFSEAHGLDALPNFHFLTGSQDALRAVWKAYGIAVSPQPDGDVQHASVIYFMGPSGVERFLGEPDSEKSSIPDWAHAIAHLVRELR